MRPGETPEKRTENGYISRYDSNEDYGYFDREIFTMQNDEKYLFYMLILNAYIKSQQY